MLDWIVEAAKAFGWERAVFTAFFLIAHLWVWRMYRGRLEDRQSEIDRLAADNREYRERFLAILDQQHSYTPKKPSPQPSASTKETKRKRWWRK